MTEAGDLKPMATEVTEADYSLMEVLVGDHHPEVKEVGGGIADEENAMLPGQENHMTLRVARRMKNRDPSPDRDVVPVLNKNVRLNRGDAARVCFNHLPKEERVEQSGSRGEGTGGSALRNQRCVPAVHEDTGRREPFEFSEVSGVVGVAVCDEDLAQIGSVSSQRVNGVQDRGCAPGKTGIDKGQAVSF